MSQPRFGRLDEAEDGKTKRASVVVAVAVVAVAVVARRAKRNQRGRRKKSA